MIRRVLRIGLLLGLLGGVAVVLARLLGQDNAARTSRAAPPAGSGEAWPQLAADPAPQAWVAPIGEVCPPSHPVKAKLTSKIFHLPGMLNYHRTKPDRCYVDAASAEADGLRAAKR